MADKLAARKHKSFKAISTAPSANKTPVGSSLPVVLYPVIQDLSNSDGTVPNVRFNGAFAYVLGSSVQPRCKGDEAGSAGGIRSGTVNGEVRPLDASTTVNAGGAPVVREGAKCMMNSGNCPGIYISEAAPSGELSASGRPAAEPDARIETPEEEGLLRSAASAVARAAGAAANDPSAAAFGALKDLGNVPSQLGTLGLQGVNLAGRGVSLGGAELFSLFGFQESAAFLRENAETIRREAPNMVVDDLFEVKPGAERAGATLSTGAQLALGGVGLLKGGLKATAKAVAKAEQRAARQLAESARLGAGAEEGGAALARIGDQLGDAGRAEEGVARVSAEVSAPKAGAGGKPDFAASEAGATEAKAAAGNAPKSEPPGDGVRVAASALMSKWARRLKEIAAEGDYTRRMEGGRLKKIDRAAFYSGSENLGAAEKAGLPLIGDTVGGQQYAQAAEAATRELSAAGVAPNIIWRDVVRPGWAEASERFASSIPNGSRIDVFAGGLQQADGAWPRTIMLDHEWPILKNRAARGELDVVIHGATDLP